MLYGKMLNIPAVNPGSEADGQGTERRGAGQACRPAAGGLISRVGQGGGIIDLVNESGRHLPDSFTRLIYRSVHIIRPFLFIMKEKILHGSKPCQKISQGIIVLNCPGLIICITPPYAHISFEELLSAGIFATRTVGQPGTHGAGITGVQGMGVNTPSAAAVAEATAGLAIELHIPKGSMLTKGMLSIMLA